MTEYIVRFLVGGAVVSAFAMLGCHSACNIDPLSRGIGVQN